MQKICRPLCAMLLAAASALLPNFATPAGAAAVPTLPDIKHVFVIVLENKSYADTFGTSTQDPYLQKTLVPMGGLLTQYYGTGHVSLDNYISMISGQAPTPDTTNDCLPGLTGSIGNYNDVAKTGVTDDGFHQVIATGGCIYPSTTKTVADLLTDSGYSWRGYMEDMGNDPAREGATCGHPLIGIGTDITNTAEAPSAEVPLGDAYATRHNPFMYFHSIINHPSCTVNVVNLNQLTTDLARIRTTPNFVFITPNLCDDGHDGKGTGAPGTLCANGQPGGLTSADAFLQRVVPQILASPAYKKDGLLIITFDESNYTESVTVNPSSGQETVDIIFSGAVCCNQKPGPNLAGVRPGTINLLNTPSLVENIVDNGYGGDQIGAVLLSKYIRPGKQSSIPYNHYSMLRTIEDLFGLRHLGYSADNISAGYFPGNFALDKNVFK